MAPMMATDSAWGSMSARMFPILDAPADMRCHNADRLRVEQRQRVGHRPG
jgi:hypothetical protein